MSNNDWTQSKGTLPEQFKDFRVPFGPIGEQVFKRTYSHVKAEGGKETWPEAVVRVVDGNLSLVEPKYIEPEEREKLIGLLLPFGILPAGRHLNASGLKGRQFLFNCHASGWDKEDPSAHFSFLFDQLMQGGGVGANYSARYLKDMPSVSKAIDLHIICRENHTNYNEFAHLISQHHGEKLATHIKVEDSREGWVDAVDLIVKESFKNDGTHEATIVIDVSDIRDRGMPLKTSGGIACGPEPLASMMTDLVRHLNGCVGRQLSSLDAMNIDHILASCVVAGGKRRSSRMSVKSWVDADIFEFINCKREDGSHWTTNISVEVDDEFYKAYNNRNSGFHSHARDVMRAIVLGKRNNGEPGIWNRSLAAKGERNPEMMYCPNPCGEIGLYMWENCNLGHINMEYFAKGMKAQMMEAFRLMSRWLVRATFGDIPQKRQRKVVDENRRIGVGFFGFHGWLALNGIRYSDCWDSEKVVSTLRTAKEVVTASATSYATQLGIPVPVKFTTLAPTGTTAALPGTTTSGQSMMAPWYKRLVRYSTMDPELQVKRVEGYEVFKDDDAPNTDIVVYWCEDPLVTKVRNAGWNPSEILEGQYDVSFENSLRVQAMLQDTYADNAISYTINLRPEDMPSEEAMEELFIKYIPRLKGTTVFPDKSRKNAPIQPISREVFEAYAGRKEIQQVEDECKGGCPVK